MKKNILKFMLAALAVLPMASCDKSSEGVTKVTYYATLEMNGEDLVVVPKGGSYNDAGCKATLKGEDVSDQIQTENPVNLQQSGVYTVNYKVVNEDGFAATASRTVVVYDASDPCDGLFSVTADSYRTYGKNVAFGSSFDVYVTKQADGTYAVSDFFGGWYSQRAGYGSKYNMAGRIAKNSDNTLSLVGTPLIQGWGDSVDSFTGTVDPATNTLHWVVEYAGAMSFDITLNRVEAAN